MAPSAPAQSPPITADIFNGSGGSEVTWGGRTNYLYEMELSQNLLTWNNLGLSWRGNGGFFGTTFAQDQGRFFYRVRQIPEDFLSFPVQGKSIERSDGVYFAFNLNALTEMPAKLRLYQRPGNSSGAWTQIAKITEFSVGQEKVRGVTAAIRYVRGAVVWLPTATGAYQVRAEAVAANGSLLAFRERNITVIPDLLPGISFLSGPASPAVEGPEVTAFSLQLTPANSPIRRVDFFDNGVYFGTDRSSSPGSDIKDLANFNYSLRRGTHQITARAYDARSVSAVTAAPYQVIITGGNARPALTILSPAQDTVIPQGQSFTIQCSLSDADGVGTLATLAANHAVDGTKSKTTPVSGATAAVTLNTTDWQPGSHSFSLSLKDSADDQSYAKYLRIYVGSGPGSSPTFAQSLATVLADAATATPSSPRFVGVQASSAVFAGGLAAGLQLDEGVLLTTGLAQLWNAGTAYTTTSENRVPGFRNFEELGDIPLENHLIPRPAEPGATYLYSLDAAVLEMDVFCTHRQLELEFQFGSEEYDEYVEQYNDSCLLTVDGVPVSLLPHEPRSITPQTVHRLTSDPASALLNPSYGHLYLNTKDDIKPTPAPSVEYDGITRRLRAHALVTPGQTHRIRLVIADLRDDSLDSGVFLGKASLRTVPVTP